MSLRFFSLILTALLCGALAGCGGSDDSPPDAPAVTIAPTATMHGTLPDVAGAISVMVGDTPAIISADTWTATLPLPADQVPVVLSVDGEELRRVLIVVR